MLSIAVLFAVLPLCAVVWKALDTVQRLAVLAAASSPQERREAFLAATPEKSVYKKKEQTPPAPALVGLSPDL